MKQETIDRIRKFTEDRDWDQFHSPANLAKSIVIEAAELLECFQWSDEEYDLQHIKEELADVLVYSQNLLDKLGLKKSFESNIDIGGEGMPWIKIVYENIQWIFSGIGVTLISIFLGKQITKSLKNRQTGKKGSVNISMEENNSIGNIQTQNAAKNSTNYQINGNYNTGLSYQDARDISLDVFKANAKTYTEEAKKIIEERAAEISEDIFKTIYIEIPVAIKKLVEPAVQEAILNAQKAYAKNASPVLKIQLVELIKQRLQAEENDIEQIVLDEALSIIPKLNSKHMDILSLHFSMLKHRNNQLCNRESFFDYIEKEIQEIC